MSQTNGNSNNVEEVRREFRQRADGVRKDVVKQLHDAAAKLRSDARDDDTQHDVQQTADRVAAGLERAANYLNSRPVEQFGEDAKQVVKENPWKTVAVIFVIGLLIGLLLRRGDGDD